MARTDLLIVSIDYIEEPVLTTLVRVKDLAGNSRVLKVRGCQPRFWTEQSGEGMHLPDSVVSVKESDKESVEGVALYEVTVKKPSQIRDVRDYFYPHYSADVRWASLVRWIYGWPAAISVDSKKLDSTLRPVNIKPSDRNVADFKLDCLWFDIETEDCLDTKEPVGRVVSIAIADSVTGIHEIGTTKPTSQRQVQRFLSSSDALESIVEHTESIPALDIDKVRVTNFDHDDPDTNEAALLWWFRRRVLKLNRDLLGGQNIKAYDLPYLRNRVRMQNRKMNRIHSGEVPVYHQYPSMGFLRKCQLFDSKIAFAEQMQGEAAATGWASLAWMATEVLGYGKVPRTRITDLMERDPMMLAIYNAWDNVCVERVAERLKLIEFYQMKVAFHNSYLNSAHSNMMLIEDMMGQLLFKRGIIMPSQQVVADRLKRESYDGGFVMDAPVGVFTNAFELDNAMEYPSAIITGNFGPDTIIDPSEYEEGYPFPVTITNAGRVYRRDFEGIMASVLRELAGARDETRRQMREAKEAGDDDTAENLDRMQRVMKENMNSWYGCLGSGTTAKTKARPFRLANSGIAADITETARIHNDWNKRLINESSLLFTTEGVSPLIDMDGKTRSSESEKECYKKSLKNNTKIKSDSVVLLFRTIYQDTDSCKVEIVNHDEAQSLIRPFTENDIRSMANILCIGLNNSYDDFVKQTLNVESNEFFKVKPDAYYRCYFSWGIKKRYAFLDYGDTKGYRGVELRRSSAPQIVKRVQHRLFDCILHGGDRQAVNRLLRELNAELLNPELTPSSDFGQPIGLKATGTMQHRAALWSNKKLNTNFDIGDKPILFIASSCGKGSLPPNRIVALEWGESPEAHTITVDRERAIAKHIAESKSFISILNALGTSWERAIAGVSQSSFGEWFE